MDARRKKRYVIVKILTELDVESIKDKKWRGCFRVFQTILALGR